MRRNVVTSGIAGRQRNARWWASRNHLAAVAMQKENTNIDSVGSQKKRRNTKMLNQTNGIGNRTVIAMSLLTLLFWAGSSWAGQTGKKSQLTDDQAKNLITSASTLEQHEQLAQYFNQKAAKLETEAKQHTDLANAYHKGKTPNMGNATLCEQAAADERKAAQENREIAAGHHKEAEGLRTSTAH